MVAFLQEKIKLTKVLFYFPSLLFAVVLSWPLSTSADQAQYFYDELGRLVGVIDGQGNIASYEYDAVGNLLSISRGAVTPPTISSITPPIVDSGTSPTITITGSGLLVASVTTSNPDILIGPVTTNTENTLDVTLIIPHPTAFGPTTVTVTVPGGVTSTTLNVQAARTTVIGTVVDFAQNPVDGAVVTTLNNLSSTTGVDGSFTIVDVPTILGNVQVTATATIEGQVVVGTSAALSPVPNGVTDVGQIKLPSPTGVRAVVINDDDDVLSIVNPSTLSIESSVPLPSGFQPREVVVTPDGFTALVTSGHTTGQVKRVSFFDLTLDPPILTSSISPPFSNIVRGIAVSCARPDLAFVDGFGGNDVASIDIPNQAIINAIDVPSSSVGKVAVLPPLGTLALARGSNKMLILGVDPTGVISDTGAGTFGFGFRNIIISPNGQIGLVPGSEESLVEVVDISSNGTITFRDVIDFGQSDPFFAPSPHSITFTKDGTKAYLLIEAKDLGVLNIDASNNVTDSGIRVPDVGSGRSEPHAIAVLEGSQRVLVRQHDSITVIDQNTHTIVGTIPVAGSGGIAPNGSFCP